MDKAQFWRVIDDARMKADRWQNMYEPLRDALSELDAREIIRWQQIFYEYQGLSYKEKLWAAAEVMLGGCSDDSFDYFRGWLTAQGKDVFMNALADPESLADVKTVKAFGRETRTSFYTPLQGHYNEARFESMLSVAADAYERKTGRNFYRVVDKYPLSDQEKAEIASDIVYAEDIDVRWGGLGTAWAETDAVLKKMVPKLHAMFNGDGAPEVNDVTFSIVEEVCANTPDGRHMLIVQASCDNTGETVWAIGDDQVCAITREDFIRNKIPYNSVLIREFPYRENTPQSVGKWRPLIEALVEITADSYLRHDGIFHIYPQWLPEEAYAHLGKELFDQMSAGCDHIILHQHPQIMDFVPRQPAGRESVLEKIREHKRTKNTQIRQNHKKRGKNEPEL
jgi:hypothetical protein